MTKLNELMAKRVQEQDSLCAKCMKGDTMLCSGIRLLDEGNHKYLNGPCVKLQVLIDSKTADSQYKNSLIPAQMIKEFRAAGLDTSINIDDYPALVHGPASVSRTKSLWKLILDFIASGYTAKYIYPLAWYSKYSKSMEELYVDLVLSLDLLVIDRIDLQLGHDFKREMFFSAVDCRLKEGRHTIVTYESLPEGNLKIEKTVFEEIRNWKEF